MMVLLVMLNTKVKPKKQVEKNLISFFLQTIVFDKVYCSFKSYTKLKVFRMSFEDESNMSHHISHPVVTIKRGKDPEVQEVDIACQLQNGKQHHV